MQIDAAIVEKSMELPHKKKMELLYYTEISLLGIYSKNLKTLIWNNVHSAIFIAMPLKIAKIWKQPINRRMVKKLCYVYTMQYYSLVIRKKILPVVIA